MAKTINGEAQLHARVDGKEIVIPESSIRRDIRLADEEGVDCLPNSTIFEQLALMGAPSHTKKILGNMRRLGKGFSGRVMETDIQEKDKIEAKNDKTEHENGKSVKQKSSQSQKSQSQIKSKSTPGSGFGKSIENRTRKRKLPKVGPPVPT
ncbi:hypothetical protein Tco_1571835 [Tanacetum coccineum]